MTTYSASSIKQLAPRHLEIMRRKMLGQKNIEICQSMGFSQSRLSIITNAPLFKLVMRQEMIKQAEKVTEIHENLIEGARLGTKLYREILEDNPQALASSDLKLKTAAVTTNLALKVINGGNGHSQEADESIGIDDENLSYEERLQRVTITKTERVTFGGGGGNGKFGDLQASLSEQLPSSEELEREENGF